MTQRVVRVAPHSAGKVVSLLYTGFGVLVLPVAVVMTLQRPHQSHDITAIALFITLAYPIGGYLFGLLSALIYNVIARIAGGLEISTEETQ